MVKEEAFEEAKELPAKHEGSHFVGNARASWAYNEADALRTVVTGGLRGRSVDLWCPGENMWVPHSVGRLKWARAHHWEAETTGWQVVGVARYVGRSADEEEEELYFCKRYPREGGLRCSYGSPAEMKQAGFPKLPDEVVKAAECAGESDAPLEVPSAYISEFEQVGLGNVIKLQNSELVRIDEVMFVPSRGGFILTARGFRLAPVNEVLWHYVVDESDWKWLENLASVIANIQSAAQWSKTAGRGSMRSGVYVLTDEEIAFKLAWTECETSVLHLSQSMVERVLSLGKATRGHPKVPTSLKKDVKRMLDVQSDLISVAFADSVCLAALRDSQLLFVDSACEWVPSFSPQGYETIDLERAKECNAATLRDQIDKAHEAVQSKAGRRRGKGDPETGRNHPRRAGQKRLKQTSVPNGRTSLEVEAEEEQLEQPRRRKAAKRPNAHDTNRLKHAKEEHDGVASMPIGKSGQQAIAADQDSGDNSDSM